jgi:hypothetical protein
VLHHDTDFDRIAAVTGQPVEWVVPRGSVQARPELPLDAHEPPFASSFAGQFWMSTASFADAVCRTMNRWPSGLTS